MASTNPGNTHVAQDDLPVQQPEGSSKNAIQGPTVDAAAQNVPAKTQPDLDPSTAVTCGRSESSGLIQGHDGAHSTSAKESKPTSGLMHTLFGPQCINEVDIEAARKAHSSRVSDNNVQPWYARPQARCRGLGDCPCSTGEGLDIDARVRAEALDDSYKSLAGDRITTFGSYKLRDP